MPQLEPEGRTGHCVQELRSEDSGKVPGRFARYFDGIAFCYDA
jgi:hypothetical protein